MRSEKSLSSICSAHPSGVELSASDGTDNHERLFAGGNCVWQGGIGRLVRQIFLAGKESQERAALLRYVVADRPAQHWIGRLERVKNRALRDLARHFDRDFAPDTGQVPEMRREYDLDHCSV
jgi:hypothetical protein